MIAILATMTGWDCFDFFLLRLCKIDIFFESTSRASVICSAIPPGQFENYILLPTLLHVVEPSLSRWPLPVCLLLKSPFGLLDLSQPIFLNAENQREFAGYPRLFGPIWSLACLAELGTDQHHGYQICTKTRSNESAGVEPSLVSSKFYISSNKIYLFPLKYFTELQTQ